MPLLKSNSLFLFSIALFFVLTSCTSSRSGKPGDTDAVYGRSEKTFYNTTGDGTVNILVTKGAGQNAVLITIVKGTVISNTPILASLLSFSADGNIVTIAGQAGIFEFSPTSKDAVIAGTAAAPSATVDTFCNGLVGAGYSEFSVNLLGNDYHFIGYTNASQADIGGSGVILKSTMGSAISYAKENFGTLQIDVSLPSPSDVTSFHASFSNASTPWQGQTGMYCHLNNVTVQPKLTGSQNTSISAGMSSSCSLINGGAKCWGQNDSGQLGNNSTAESHVPVQVQGLTSGVTAVSLGNSSACAVVNGGAVCWGLNNFGQLGNNSTTDSPVPVQVQGLTSGVTAISAGGMGACAVLNGAAKCWGDYKILGNNTYANSLVPVQVQGLTSGVTAISVGFQSVCAVVNGGAVCWGDNLHGQLGNNSIIESVVPVQVQGLTSGVTAVAASTGLLTYSFSCAVVNGGAQCWGYNNNGQLGNNSTTESHVPVLVQGLTSGVTAIDAGNVSACAIANGAVTCWGYNNNGQLGNNSTTESHVPVQVQGLTSGATAVAAGGGAYACAFVSGVAQCWGNNLKGQLGNNSTTESHVPVLVQ